MLNLGFLGFASPWLLLGLLALPAIWWLLRLVPPAPSTVRFPPFMFIQQIEDREETPDHTPWWLLLLRLLIVTLLILALAGPLLNPRAPLGGSGPVTLILDDDWLAAPGFEERRQTMVAVLEQARRSDRPVRLVRTAPQEFGAGDQAAVSNLLDAGDLLELVPGIEAKPWAADHARTLSLLQGIGELGGIVWLRSASVVDEAASSALADFIADTGDATIIGDANELAVPWLGIPELSALGFDIQINRVSGEPPVSAMLVASGPNGQVLARQAVSLAPGETTTQISLQMPRELRNETARISLEPKVHAGQQVLLDERWRRRTVGLWSRDLDDSQPLLNELYFVRNATRPYAEIIEGPLLELLDKPMSLLIMADHGDFDEAEIAALAAWIDEGGVLLRFAGPRLAASRGTLLPVKLRGGERELGGAMSWSEPLRIASFGQAGPFAALSIPDDVRIRRQVLAEPSPELAGKTLAELEDGTPLITGVQSGAGWTILVHTTANADWSNLALSGLFVDLIRRAIDIGRGAGGITRGLLETSLVLDARGQLAAPEQNVPSINAAELRSAKPGPAVPPGLWGPVPSAADGAPASEQDLPRTAFNVQQGLDQLYSAPVVAGARTEAFQVGQEIDLGHWLLLFATLLLLADLLIALVLRGLIDVPRRAAAGMLVLLAAGFAAPAAAQSTDIDPAQAIALTDQTRIGYVKTGDRELDRQSRNGLAGLIATLAQRTSIEAGPPVGVDLGSDPIELFPLLYWPVTASHPDLDADIKRRIADFLRSGGTVLFDTRDAGLLFPGQDGGGPGEQRLGELLDGMDLAPLEPISQNHVLTRSFYLIQDFPGRFTGQTLWVDRAQTNVNDGVSGIIIGAHDWAGAWATDDRGRTLYPVVPGGERQREMARRFGVNLIMYAMTGNYKTDQVHIPALLERLGE